MPQTIYFFKSRSRRNLQNRTRRSDLADRKKRSNCLWPEAKPRSAIGSARGMTARATYACFRPIFPDQLADCTQPTRWRA
jgi:hypothetical protein